MCGIVGLLNTSGTISNELLQSTIDKLTRTLIHRGPDDGGTWIEVDSSIALGHRRLSIIDLSVHGHQPKFSSTGRYVITYNGEVYNFKSIRTMLSSKGYRFQGHSDTEVILAAIEEWGVYEAVKKFTGMFAFGLWDRYERTLYLARDRLGEKPLYYGWMGSTFLFGSELKCFYGFKTSKNEIDRNVLSLYLRYNYIPAPYSIYKGINKLLPGSILVIKPENVGFYPEPLIYWSARDAAIEGINEPFTGSFDEALIELEKLLIEAVSQQMVSDVPLGAFLSGGIDSSTIVALMQTQSNKPVKTFSIGFHEESYNEAQYAKNVANYLHTEHTELYVDPAKALSVVPRLPILYDEPFADSSQIPTFLVSELTKQRVSVSLSGDGGDELFCGYNRYLWCKKIWNSISWMPFSLRKSTSDILTILSPHTWDNLYKLINIVLPKSFKHRLPGDKIYKLAQLLAVDTPDAMYNNLVSCWKEPTSVVLNACEPKTQLSQKHNFIPNFTQRMMYLDLITYLPDDILVKVDRASMGVSLEARAPFLNHKLVEYAWKLPLSMKVKNGNSKWILRQLLYKYVPAKLIDRPKMGFGVPIDEWLRGPLKDWAETLLDEKRLKEEGFFNYKIIREKWHEHLLGSRNWQYHLWAILMFEAWFERWHR